MKIGSAIHRITSLFFINGMIFSIFFATALAQQTEDQQEEPQKKPKVIFKTQKTDTSKVISPLDTSKSDTAKDRIIFKKNALLKEGKITLLSEKRFKMYESTYPVGDRGKNLKNAMSDNSPAVGLVDKAYKSKDTGMVLMVVGGITIAVGIITVASTSVTVSETKTTTYYWLPLVTLGSVIGGIGYAKYVSVSKHLDKAVKLYNQELTHPAPVDNKNTTEPQEKDESSEDNPQSDKK